MPRALEPPSAHLSHHQHALDHSYGRTNTFELTRRRGRKWAPNDDRHDGQVFASATKRAQFTVAVVDPAAVEACALEGAGQGETDRGFRGLT
jgi:hypothetical protein